MIKIYISLLQGEAMSTKKLAKMAVALKACHILHKAGTYYYNLVLVLLPVTENQFTCCFWHTQLMPSQSFGVLGAILHFTLIFHVLYTPNYNMHPDFLPSSYRISILPCLIYTPTFLTSTHNFPTSDCLVEAQYNTRQDF